MHPLRVAMPPDGLIFEGNEAYSLQDAFRSVPGPPGLQTRAKNVKKCQKPQKRRFFRIFPSVVRYPFKGGCMVRRYSTVPHIAQGHHVCVCVTVCVRMDLRPPSHS